MHCAMCSLRCGSRCSVEYVFVCHEWAKSEMQTYISGVLSSGAHVIWKMGAQPEIERLHSFWPMSVALSWCRSPAIYILFEIYILLVAVSIRCVCGICDLRNYLFGSSIAIVRNSKLPIFNWQHYYTTLTPMSTLYSLHWHTSLYRFHSKAQWMWCTRIRMECAMGAWAIHVDRTLPVASWMLFEMYSFVVSEWKCIFLRFWSYFMFVLHNCCVGGDGVGDVVNRSIEHRNQQKICSDS